MKKEIAAIFIPSIFASTLLAIISLTVDPVQSAPMATYAVLLDVSCLCSPPIYLGAAAAGPRN